MPTLIDDAVTSLKMSTCKAVIKKFKTTEPEWKRTRLYDGVLVGKAKKNCPMITVGDLRIERFQATNSLTTIRHHLQDNTLQNLESVPVESTLSAVF